MAARERALAALSLIAEDLCGSYPMAETKPSEAGITIRMVSHACEAGDHDSCKHPKCECDCHENPDFE